MKEKGSVFSSSGRWNQRIHCELEVNTLTRRSIAVLVLLLGVLAIGFTGLAQQSATEAPAGFETPTLAENPGSKSTSNGIVEPPGDAFAVDQQIYERIHDVNSGLGPVFNGRACAECHQNPVSASQFTELRAGHKDANGDFVNPTVAIDDGATLSPADPSSTTEQ
jgi:hypothetical protein